MLPRFSPTIRVDRTQPITSKDRLFSSSRSNTGIGVYEEIHLVHAPSVLECVITGNASGVVFQIQPDGDDFIFEWNGVVGDVRPNAGDSANLGNSSARWNGVFSQSVNALVSIQTPLFTNGGSTIEIGDHTRPDTIGTLNFGDATNYWLGVHTDILRLHGNAAPVVNGEFRLDGTDVFVFSGGALRNLSSTGGSGAPDSALYVTLSTNATLTAERVLTGTTNQLTITDNGAGSTVVLSTPQNIHTGASPTFAGLTLNGTLDTNGNDLFDIGDIGFRNTTDRLITMGSGGAAVSLDLSLKGFNNTNAGVAGGNLLIIPGTGGAGGAGGSTKIRNSGDTADVALFDNNTIRFSQHTLPDADNTYNLGSAILRWVGVHTRILRVHNFTADPVVNGEITLNGTDVKVFSGGSVRNLSNSLDLTSVTTDILPDNDNIRNIGSVTNAWNDVYANELRIYHTNIYQGSIIGDNVNTYLKLDAVSDILLRTGSGGGIVDVEGKLQVRGNLQFSQTTNALLPFGDNNNDIGSTAAGFRDIFATRIVYINETTVGGDSGLTDGLVISQEGGVNTSAILLKEDNLTHGMTSIADTKTYGKINNAVNANNGGGIEIEGFTGTSWGDFAINLQATVGGTPPTTKAASSTGVIILDSAKKSGTTRGTCATNENLLAIRNAASCRAIIDADGDLHLDATSNINVWDDYPDWQIARALRASISPELSKNYPDLVEKYKPILAKTGVVTYNDDGHHFISMKGMALFNLDMGFQLGQMYTAHEQRIYELEQQVLALTGGHNG